MPFPKAIDLRDSLLSPFCTLCTTLCGSLPHSIVARGRHDNDRRWFRLRLRPGTSPAPRSAKHAVRPPVPRQMIPAALRGGHSADRLAVSGGTITPERY